MKDVMVTQGVDMKKRSDIPSLNVTNDSNRLLGACLCMDSRTNIQARPANVTTTAFINHVLISTPYKTQPTLVYLPLSQSHGVYNAPPPAHPRPTN